MSSVLRMIFVAVFLTTSAGCTTNPATGETEFNSSAVGAVVGGLAGGAIGIALGNGDAALAGATPLGGRRPDRRGARAVPH